MSGGGGGGGAGDYSGGPLPRNHQFHSRAPWFLGLRSSHHGKHCARMPESHGRPRVPRLGSLR
eukprot:6061473-Pyramimonas_sp.AAC.1